MGEPMKVDPNLQSILNVQSDAVQNGKAARASHTQESAASESSSAQVDGTDTVRFSPKFAEAQQLTSKLQEIPDVRASRVAMLRERIQQGTYKPDPLSVAGSILNDAINQGGKK
jgi:flagellar biosynthesis anti-sigma factor FlgM